MKIGRNLPRGRANQDNQHELDRAARRDLGSGEPAAGNPWDSMMQEEDFTTTAWRRRNGRQQHPPFDVTSLIVWLAFAAIIVGAVVLMSSGA